MIGSSLLWEVMLWLSVSVSCIRYSKGANLGLKCVRMRLAAGLCPDPLGELERSPSPHSRNWGVPTSKGKGKGRGKGKEGEGKGGRGRKGRKRRGGSEGKGRLASHTIFRPWHTHTRTDRRYQKTAPGLRSADNYRRFKLYLPDLQPSRGQYHTCYMTTANWTSAMSGHREWSRGFVTVIPSDETLSGHSCGQLSHCPLDWPFRITPYIRESSTRNSSCLSNRNWLQTSDK